MSIPSFSLEGKTAIVTGARRGIGRATALTFAEAGADVAICDWVVEGGELAAVAEEVQRLGRRSLPVQVDVSKKADVDNLVQKVISEFGTIDILVNNAGVASTTPLLEISEDEWDMVINVDLKGCYLCSQAAGKIMVERKKGNIINISSVFGINGEPAWVAHNSAKAGVIMLTKALACNLGPYNVRVNAIAPGSTKTEMLRPLWENPELLQSLEASNALGRIAQPNEVANVALFLASNVSSYVTGHTIVADAGWTA